MMLLLLLMIMLLMMMMMMMMMMLLLLMMMMLLLKCMKQLRTLGRNHSFVTGTTHKEFLESHSLHSPLTQLLSVLDQQITRLEERHLRLEPHDVLKQHDFTRLYEARFTLCAAISQEHDTLHRQLHMNSDEATCPFCSKAFASIHMLKRHILHDHQVSQGPLVEFDFARDALNGLPTCRHCHARFISWQNLQFHIQHGACTAFDPAQASPVHLFELRQQLLDIHDGGDMQRLSANRELCAFLTNRCVLCGVWASKTQQMGAHMSRVHAELRDILARRSNTVTRARTDSPCVFCLAEFRSKTHTCPVKKQLALALADREFRAQHQNSAACDPSPNQCVAVEFECPDCRRTFGSEASWRTHQKQSCREPNKIVFFPARDQKPGHIACNHCSASHGSLTALKRHIELEWCKAFDPNRARALLVYEHPLIQECLCAGDFGALAQDQSLLHALSTKCGFCGHEVQVSSGLTRHLGWHHFDNCTIAHTYARWLQGLPTFARVQCVCAKAPKGVHVCTAFLQLALFVHHYLRKFRDADTLQVDQLMQPLCTFKPCASLALANPSFATWLVHGNLNRLLTPQVCDALCQTCVYCNVRMSTHVLLEHLRTQHSMLHESHGLVMAYLDLLHDGDASCTLCHSHHAASVECPVLIQLSLVLAKLHGRRLDHGNVGLPADKRQRGSPQKGQAGSTVQRGREREGEVQWRGFQHAEHSQKPHSVDSPPRGHLECHDQRERFPDLSILRQGQHCAPLASTDQRMEGYGAIRASCSSPSLGASRASRGIDHSIDQAADEGQVDRVDCAFTKIALLDCRPRVQVSLHAMGSELQQYESNQRSTPHYSTGSLHSSEAPCAFEQPAACDQVWGFEAGCADSADVGVRHQYGQHSRAMEARSCPLPEGVHGSAGSDASIGLQLTLASGVGPDAPTDIAAIPAGSALGQNVGIPLRALENPSQICYMNAVILGLTWCTVDLPDSRAAWLTPPGVHEDLTDSSAKPFYLLTSPAFCSSIREWDRPFMQHDAGEFANFVLERTMPAFVNCEWESHQELDGQMQVIESGGPYWPVHLQFQAGGKDDTLQGLITAWSEASRGLQALIAPSKTLCLYVERFSPGSPKLHSRVLHDTEVSLPKFQTELGTVQLTYSIRALCFHTGPTAASGHWQAVLRREDGWWIYDDGVPPSRHEFLPEHVLCNSVLFWLTQCEPPQPKYGPAPLEVSSNPPKIAVSQENAMSVGRNFWSPELVSAVEAAHFQLLTEQPELCKELLTTCYLCSEQPSNMLTHLQVQHSDLWKLSEPTLQSWRSHRSEVAGPCGSCPCPMPLPLHCWDDCPCVRHFGMLAHQTPHPVSAHQGQRRPAAADINGAVALDAADQQMAAGDAPLAVGDSLLAELLAAAFE